MEQRRANPSNSSFRGLRAWLCQSPTLWLRGHAGPLVLLLILCAAQSLIIALSQHYGVSAVRLVQLLLASLIPPAAWIANRSQASRADILHGFGPFTAVAALSQRRPARTDMACYRSCPGRIGAERCSYRRSTGGRSYPPSAMEQQRPYLDPDLTLARLSRKMGVPAKSLSATINLTTGGNVSRFINEARIAAAQETMLRGETVTKAMLMSGFNTKSNFNREFLRVVGKSPSAWLNARPRRPGN